MNRSARPESSTTIASDNTLERAIGQQVRAFRQQLRLTVVEAARRSGLSPGMLSKIENGHISPSLATLQTLSTGLNVPVTALFRKFEESRDCSFVPAGEGLPIERQGTRAGHRYELLGHTVGKPVVMEPFLITLSSESEVFPLFQHGGVEFIYLLEGEVAYRHGSRIYHLRPGDSLLFDAEAAHGPEELLVLPIRFLAILSRYQGD